MKSKLLQNSKDLLSRSFNPTKCKTSLRLAGSRLKLLRNKKEVQLNQMKKEIAQLLESGQDRTARIRVEHVIREEKMMAAYDLLEIYCELIVARLPIIESQKECPIDLKEAIASVVFASPRCGDVPELLDVRKHFSSKYGKEFTTAATELRPQCGVGRLLVEKLSATSPDGQTKTKILGAIAELHNVKWDPQSFDENDSGGPSLISKEKTELQAEPLRVDAAHPSNNVNSSPLNFSQQDTRISSAAEKLSSGPTSDGSTKIQPEARPPGDRHNSHHERPRWNMEFKDASSAAEAAAEAAERASMAARAAAELSTYGRIMTHYSTESPQSDVYTLKDGLEAPSNSNSAERYSKASPNTSSSEPTGLGNPQIDGIEPSKIMPSSRFEEGDSGSEVYSQSASLKPKASGNDDSSYQAVPFVDENAQINSLKEVSEVEISMKKQSFSYENETANCWPEKAANHGEGKIAREKSLSSSRSQSSISDDVNIFANIEDQKLENNAGEDPVMSISKSSFHGEAPETSSHEPAAVFFDKSDSEGDDDHGPDKGPIYDEQDLEFHLPSLGQNSPDRQSINTASWSHQSSSSNILNSASLPLFFTGEKSSPYFSENTTVRDDSELDDFAPVTFDDSEGPTSDIDEDMNVNKVNLLHEYDDEEQSIRSEFEDKTGQSVGSLFKKEGYSEIDSKTLSVSSDDEEMHLDRSQVNISNAGSSEKFSLLKPSAEPPAWGSIDSQIESKELGDESTSETEEKLNFGKLTGGFRHKGHNHLPIFKNISDVSSSVKKEEETSAMITSSTHSSSVEQPKIGTTLEHNKSSRTPDLHSELLSYSSDSSVEEDLIPKSSGQKQAPTAVKAVKTKLALRPSNSIFGSDDSDLDEDSQKESLTRKSHVRSGISRRTKASRSSTGTNSLSETRLKSEALSSDGMDRKPTTSYDSGTPNKSESHRRNSVASMPVKPMATPVLKQEPKKWLKSEVHASPDNQQEIQPSSRNSSLLENSEQPKPVEVASKPTNSTPYKTMQEYKISKKPEEVPNTQQNSGTSSKTSSDKVDMTKKASHVHPKLPDYDTLVQSLRMNNS